MLILINIVTENAGKYGRCGIFKITHVWGNVNETNISSVDEKHIILKRVTPGISKYAVLHHNVHEPVTKKTK